MIYDTLNFLDTEVKHTTRGMNARIATVNTLKTTEAPEVCEFLTWDLSLLPSQMDMPTLQVVWTGSRDLEPQSQSKWRGNHLFSLNFWMDETDSETVRKDMALWAHAARLLVDDIPVNFGDADTVNDISLDIAGWAGAGRLYTWMAISFRLKCRDENPE